MSITVNFGVPGSVSRRYFDDDILLFDDKTLLEYLKKRCASDFANNSLYGNSAVLSTDGVTIAFIKSEMGVPFVKWKMNKGLLMDLKGVNKTCDY